MSTNAKVITWIIVVVVVAGGIWWWVAASQMAVSPTSNPAAENQSPTPIATAPTPSNGIAASDNSNAGLQAQLSNIDSQTSGFASDNTSVNQGMSDQQVQQSQF